MEYNKSIELKSNENDTTLTNKEISINNYEELSSSSPKTNTETKAEDNFNYYSSNKPIKIGSTICLFWYGSFPLITIGPHWMYFSILNGIIMSISICYFYYLWDLFYPIGRNIGMIIFLFQVTCYWFTAFFNPGTSFNNYKKEFIIPAEEQRINIRYCNDCKIVMDLELDTVHCPECDICIQGLDHHCPWTGKCIGKNTLWTFYGFIFGTVFLLVYLVFGLVFIKPIR